jgi:deoxycytidine triphosphate deaminase
MIVGQDILDAGLIAGGVTSNHKHSTYDLTIGEIIPIGKDAALRRRTSGPVPYYYIEPREMVWVLSNEQFNMPNRVTGLATLRTSFTKAGLLALNVGIIDPLFRGPISTALINFSDRPRRINVGDRFFRVAFFEHEDVSAYHEKDESIHRTQYLMELEKISYSDFVPSFLNIPNFNDEYYDKRFWMILWRGISRNKKISIPIGIVLVIFIWYIFSKSGFPAFLQEKWEIIAKFLK